MTKQNPTTAPGGILLAGKPCRLRYSFNAMCALESALGGLENMRAGSLTAVRALLWCGMLEYDPGATPEKAGRLLSRHLASGGTLSDVCDRLTAVLARDGWLPRSADAPSSDTP